MSSARDSVDPYAYVYIVLKMSRNDDRDRTLAQKRQRRLLCERTPIVSSKVMALMLSDAKMASLSASVGSSLLGTLADNITHMSHKLTLTARKSARLSGDP